MGIVNIPIEEVYLRGELVVPDQAKGLILFVHGSGSSHASPRNQLVAKRLQKEGFATLLFDLLTENESDDLKKRFNIPLLTHRLITVTHWVVHQSAVSRLPLGYFGASTGAAAALEAAVALPQYVRVVVSRGGRPDMANQILPQVKIPVLLLVGSHDLEVAEQLAGKKELILIPGATHLFEEPGTLELVIVYSIEWFTTYLAALKPVG
jgi:pimeloyl-ACP methyl ester carboxylesterase